MIVGRLPGNDHIVDMTLAEAGAGDTHKLRFLLQFRDGAATQVTHSGAQAADELEDHGLERSAIGNAALDALRDKLGETILAGALALDYAFTAQLGTGKIGGALEVTLAGALAHGCQGAHAAIALEAASLIENGFAGALVDAGKEGADHDGTGAGGDGLGDFSGVL